MINKTPGCMIKNEIRRRLLLKELVTVIDKFEKCTKKIDAQAQKERERAQYRINYITSLWKCFGPRVLNDFIDEDHRINKRKEIFYQKPPSTSTFTIPTSSQQLLYLLRSVKQKIESSQPFNQNDISEFKRQLSRLKIGIENQLTKEKLNSNLLKEDQTSYEWMLSNLTDCMRAILRPLDWIITQCSGESRCFEEKGETPWALYLTGYFQFFPRPIASMSDALEKLENLTDRLEQTIQHNQLKIN